jgi:hypothetical protein
MIHYLNIGGQDRPLSFAYSVAYDYEIETGRHYDPDIQELATQIIKAGAALNTDDIGTAARSISMVRFVDILYHCLRAGHRKTKTPVTFDKHDVADWMGEHKQAVSDFTTMLLEANFNLKPAEGEEAETNEDDDTKKKSQAPSTGTNS